MDELDSEAEPKAGAPEAPVAEAETAVSADEEDEFLSPDAIPSDLDDAMSWLEDLAAEESAPVEPLPTVADVLDEGLTDLFEVEEEQPVPEIEEVGEIEPEVDLDFLEEELFSLIEEEEVLEDVSMDLSGALIDDNTEDAVLEAIAAAAAAEATKEQFNAPVIEIEEEA